MKPRRTPHQIEIMGLVLAEAGEGRFLSSREIFDRVSYKPETNYAAVRICIAGLVKIGMLVRKRSGRNITYVPTERGYDWFRPLR